MNPEPQKRCPRCGQVTCVCPKFETVDIKIPPQSDSLSLRNQVASRLQEYEEVDVTKATYKIFFQKENVGDMSTLPAILRGNMAGQGDVIAEITITKKGKFSKSQIEQQVESIPSLSGADYSADITLTIEIEEE